MAPKLNVGRAYQENHPELASKWDLRSADLAITQHERGDFSQSAKLVDAMGRDDRIKAVLTTRILAVLGLVFCMEAAPPPPDAKPANDVADAGEDDEKPEKQTELADDELEPTDEAKRIAAEQEVWFWKYAPEHTQREALRWRLMMGFAIGEVIWRDERGKLCDEPQRVKIWHLQHCRWDQWKECFVLNTADAGEVEVRHGDGKWIIFGNGQRPWMEGYCRAVWLLFLGRQYGFRDLFVFGERTGQGILKAKVPPTMDGERNRLVATLRAIWRGVIAELPQGPEKEGLSHDLEMLETGADEEVFEAMLGRVDLCIAVLFLGQNLTTEVSGDGARSATSAHDRIRNDYLKADTEQHSSDWRSGVLEPFAERKYGDRELAPYPKWDADPPEDEKATAEGQKAAGEAVAAWQTAGYDVENIDEIAKRHGLKVKKSAQPQAPAAAGPGAPGAPGAAPAGGPGGGAQPGQPAAQPGKAPAPAPTRAPVAAPARPLAAALFSQGDEDPGFHQGQEYVDELVRSGTQRASEALAVDIANILRVVQASESPEMLRAGLAALYSDSTLTELEGVLVRARLMAELAGKYSVIEDVMGDTQ
jgi:phage gp29-like protein